MKTAVLFKWKLESTKIIEERIYENDTSINGYSRIPAGGCKVKRTVHAYDHQKYHFPVEITYMARARLVTAWDRIH